MKIQIWWRMGRSQKISPKVQSGERSHPASMMSGVIRKVRTPMKRFAISISVSRALLSGSAVFSPAVAIGPTCDEAPHWEGRVFWYHDAGLYHDAGVFMSKSPATTVCIPPWDREIPSFWLTETSPIETKRPTIKTPRSQNRRRRERMWDENIECLLLLVTCSH